VTVKEFTVRIDCESREWLMPSRVEQRRATYLRIVEVAVEALIENGYAATTALAVQKRAGITRGAMLHHFPTREELSTAAVQRLVEMNLEGLREESDSTPRDGDPVIRGIHVLHRASRRKGFATELELWAAARVDAKLRAALLGTERVARKQLYEMIDEIFGSEVVARPGYRAMVDMTVQFIRGLTISGTMQERSSTPGLVGGWAAAAKVILDFDST
jgi:AcrR family transcriptional regulator